MQEAAFHVPLRDSKQTDAGVVIVRLTCALPLVSAQGRRDLRTRSTRTRASPLCLDELTSPVRPITSEKCQTEKIISGASNTVRSFNQPAAPRVSLHAPFLVKRLQQVAPVFPGSNAKPLDHAGHGRIGRRVLHQRESMRGMALKPPKRRLMRLPNAMPGFSTAR
jgi:hypothetical protein